MTSGNVNLTKLLPKDLATAGWQISPGPPVKMKKGPDQFNVVLFYRPQGDDVARVVAFGGSWEEVMSEAVQKAYAYHRQAENPMRS